MFLKREGRLANKVAVARVFFFFQSPVCFPLHHRPIDRNLTRPITDVDNGASGTTSRDSTDPCPCVPPANAAVTGRVCLRELLGEEEEATSLYNSKLRARLHLHEGFVLGCLRATETLVQRS